MNVASHIHRVSEPPVESINRLRRELDPERTRIIDLGQAIPDFGPPPEALAVLDADPLATAIHRYTPDAGLPELREAIAESLREKGDREAHAGQILVTAGANHAFLLVCACILDAGDRVGLLSPFFLNHPMAVNGSGGQVVEVDPSEGLDYDPTAIERAVVEHRLRALVAVHPSNPSGKLFTRDEMAELVEICSRRKVWLIVDEVYREFVHQPGEGFTAGGLPGAADSAFTLGSFSKELGMAGWRVGWVKAPEAMIPYLLKVQDYSIICAPHAGQRIAAAALASRPGWTRSHLPELAARRAAILEPLADSGLFEICTGLGGFFVWFRPRTEIDSSLEAFDLVRAASVLVLPGAAFGQRWRAWFRISYGACGVEALSTAAERLICHFSARGS